MSLGKFWHGVIHVLVHGVFTSSFTLLSTFDISRNGLLDCQLDSTLGNEAQVGTRETVGLAGNVVDIDIWSNWGLAKLSSQNGSTRGFIWQRHINQGIETTRTAKSIVELFGSVGGANDENILLRSHAVHLGQKLVDDTVRSTTSVAN